MLKCRQLSFADLLHHAPDTSVGQDIGLYSGNASPCADVAIELLRRVLVADDSKDVVLEFHGGDDGRCADVASSPNDEYGRHCNVVAVFVRGVSY